MKKKLLSLALAATMLIGASLPVSAETTDRSVSGEKNLTDQIEATGEVKEITINVTITTVSGGNTVILNPYGVEISNSTETLIADDIKFKNNTNAPVALQLKGAVDLSGNNAIDVVTTTTRPAAPQSKKQVNVNVSYQLEDGAKMISTPTATKADVPVSYAKRGTAGSITEFTALSSSPVLAQTGLTSETKKVMASGKDTGAVYSDTVVLKFGGWCMPMVNEQWPSDAKIKVITVYDFRTEDNSKRSMFKSFNVG